MAWGEKNCGYCDALNGAYPLYQQVARESEKNNNLHQRIIELEELLKTARAMLRDLLDNWFYKIYPADIFVGGEDSDEGTNEVARYREGIRKLLEETESGARDG
jgi:hypothetical protein